MEQKRSHLSGLVRGLAKSPIWYYLLIFCLSLLANWFVQLSYFLYKVDRNPLAFSGQRTLADYTTGFVGDAILLPIMNVAILYVVRHIKGGVAKHDLLRIAPAGLAADILLHFMQGYLRLTNWSMPRPFEWNFVSYWHMVSFFFQISFVFLFFFLVAVRRSRMNTAALRAVWIVFGLIGIFVVLFLYDYGPLRAPLLFVTAKLASTI